MVGGEKIMKELWDFIQITWLVICFGLTLGWIIGAAFKESVREFLQKLSLTVANLNITIKMNGTTVNEFSLQKQEESND